MMSSGDDITLRIAWIPESNCATTPLIIDSKSFKKDETAL